MDAQRFDTLARAFGAGSSRRGLARFLGGLALGGIMLSGAENAEAKKKKKKKNKKKKKDCPNNCSGGTLCCDGTCVSVITDRNNCGACGNVCGVGQYCSNTQCTPCENPLALCTVAGQEQCVNLQTDRDNCGSCGNICPKDPKIRARDRICQAGRCVCPAVECTNGQCCTSDYSICVAGGTACCPNGFPVHCPEVAGCCPAGYTCGGSCGQPCCAV